MYQHIKINDFYKWFDEDHQKNTDELAAYIKRLSPKISREAIYRRIAYLKERGVLISKGRGLYALKRDEKRTFAPKLERKHVTLFERIKKEFPDAEVSLWPVRWLHAYMVHLPAINWTIVEVEKDVASPVLAFLRHKDSHIYLNPTKKEITEYIIHNHESIIIKNLVTQSPLMKIKNVVTPTIEKILIDLLIDKTVFFPYQGQELVNIYENVFNTYEINVTALIRYATRRNQQQKLLDFIKENLQIKKLEEL